MYTVNSPELLESLAKSEENPRVRDKLRALLLLSKGTDYKLVCQTFDVNKDTLRYHWLKRWNDNGYEGLVIKKGRGRKSIFSESQKKLLRQYILSQEKRIVCKELVKYVRDRWNLSCDEETIRKVLKSMKLSWQKPCKSNYKADPMAQKVFLKGARWN
jgi:transposase